MENDENNSKKCMKNPGVAAVLSFFIVGLGQIYNGDIGKGTGLFVMWCFALLISIVLIGIPFAILIWMYGMHNAYQRAQKLNEIDS